MKKLIVIILVIMLLCTLICFSACNQQIFDFNYKFDRAYVKIGETWTDLAIKMWNDYDGEQIQLTLYDGTVMIVCSVNCILYNGSLPGVN